MVQYRYEASEVAVMTGGTAKVRPLTTEEIGLQRVAEEKAQQLKEELEALKNIPPATSPGAAVAAVIAKSRSVTKSSLSRVPSSSENSSTQHSNSPLDSSGSMKKPTVPLSSSKEVDSSSKGVIQLEETPRKSKSVLVAASMGGTSNELSGTAVQLIRKLEKDELEIAGKALQMSVMHRGGGPFGSGRLVGDEAKQLSTALRAAYELLKRDAGSAAAVQIETPASKKLEEDLKLPALKGAAGTSDVIPRKVVERVQPVVQVERSQAVTSTEASTARQQPSSLQTPTPILLPDHTPQSSIPVESKPIALGLDSFLQNPRSMELIVSSPPCSEAYVSMLLTRYAVFAGIECPARRIDSVLVDGALRHSLSGCSL